MGWGDRLMTTLSQLKLTTGSTSEHALHTQHPTHCTHSTALLQREEEREGAP